ncbi:L,D-transpeptidase family protein [Salinisphaera sp. USBA-960]|uniref:L,D-transpeptidase family protein n=1 Tax=Salinisphaera orenii TaxID=856731 RepID=UPI000DBE9C20|nr:L,D-transpeptidase family protein [Salifodinibacter halophilus]NNC25456.1 L,D-transpeptidase family protein [Salifodinibacter halophilus]
MTADTPLLPPRFFARAIAHGRVLVTTLFFAVLSLYASVVPATTDPARFENGAEQVDRVVVMKSQRELYLYRDGIVIDSYPIGLGLDPVGTKRRSGDDKTPVGAYIIDWRNPDSRFHLSLHISYPNAADRAHARKHGFDPGKNIMIHGQPDYSTQKRSGDWTHGCIAVSNKAINEIWRLVPKGTPIQIYR